MLLFGKRMIGPLLRSNQENPLNELMEQHELRARLEGDFAFVGARKDDSEIIAVEHVEKAISKQDYRQDRYRELMQEQVLRGIKMIDTEGERVAQVNALSVLQTGRYRFGQASRITATARLGRAGVVDIEREAKLGGDLHSKGVMILSSYLAHHYAANQPLPLGRGPQESAVPTSARRSQIPLWRTCLHSLKPQQPAPWCDDR